MTRTRAGREQAGRWLGLVGVSVAMTPILAELGLRQLAVMIPLG